MDQAALSSHEPGRDQCGDPETARSNESTSTTPHRTRVCHESIPETSRQTRLFHLHRSAMNSVSTVPGRTVIDARICPPTLVCIASLYSTDEAV